MERGAGRIGPLERRLRDPESHVERLVVDQQDAALRVGDLLCPMIENVLFRDVCGVSGSASNRP